jgi:prepilin-type N-terminal cleavage/methylation domain-containing protein
MKLFKSSEKGFTLVELLVAIPIIGLLGLAMGAVLIQLLHSDRISHRMVAVRQVQTAGDRVSLDGVQAQFVSGVGDDMTAENWSLVFNWSGGWTDDNGDYITRKVTVEYYLEASDGLYKLKRREWLNVPPTAAPTVDSTVAQHLDVSRMSCEWDDSSNRTFAFKVVSTVGTKTEERTYNITPRSVG